MAVLSQKYTEILLSSRLLARSPWEYLISRHLVRRYPMNYPRGLLTGGSYNPKIAQHRVLNRANSCKCGFIDFKRIGAAWEPGQQPLDLDGILLTRGIVLGTLQQNIDETTPWIPFMSPGLQYVFKERFGGRGFDDPGLFPGAERDYKSTFHKMFGDGNLPLFAGKVSGVNISKAGERLMAMLQSEMLEKTRFAVRGRVT
ncbi:hypothetical protein F5Y06DRAFT_136247 [Hypoxylon sp. FL0890]|nr:hypothetical protein F5Y06DRAFT_136247 [Hypoxylon sp. FL0890]